MHRPFTIASFCALVTLVASAASVSAGDTWPPQIDAFDAATASRAVYYAAAAYSDTPQACLGSAGVTVVSNYSAVDIIGTKLFGYVALSQKTSEGNG